MAADPTREWSTAIESRTCGSLLTTLTVTGDVPAIVGGEERAPYHLTLITVRSAIHHLVGTSWLKT
jgi:hypothetical protein